jgi:hypothetical protein
MRFKQAQSKAGRWAVPVTAVAVTGAAIASGVMPTSASAAPVLPAKTPAQLLADVASAHKMPALTGTVVETTSLGLPQLPQAGNPTSLSSLLTGSHTVKVYWQDARHFRLAVPQSMSETDIVRNGATGWLWESNQNTVMKFSASPKAAGNSKNVAQKIAKMKAMRKAGLAQRAGKGLRPGMTLPPGITQRIGKAQGTGKAQGITKTQGTPAGMPDTSALTPQQAAAAILAQVGKTTVVSTQSNVDVAGQAAYQLVLAPRSAESTISSIRLAVDGKTGVPLRVQVFGKGSSTPAFQVGFTSLSYTAPAASNFNFTPPPGATVTTPGQKSAQGQQGAQAPNAANPLQGAGTYGSGWLSVAEIPSAALTGGSLPGGPVTKVGPGAFPGQSSSSSAAPGTPAVPGAQSASAAPGGSPLSGNSQEIVSAILGSGTTVHGAWGSGSLVHAGLLNILITGGKLYVGAVSPSVLEAAVGHVTSGSSASSPAAAG